ncbi:MAG: hypothetical protein IE926_12355 [Micrococcales bacterium]|nr:hypothetical protein [Micrococcales bacterium]
MNLHPCARRYYKLLIETDPADVTVEASFDRGVTFHEATDPGNGERWWLVAGSVVDIGEAVARITEDVKPILRWPDNPEIEAGVGPIIRLSWNAEP